jgi:membrane protease YdiL (CAAX protease family)
MGLAFAGRRSGSLLVPITAHITINALGMAIL